MISIYSCNENYLCNTSMLVEGFSSAVYWRIAAIFSTIAALFSLGIVLWFLTFRDNPDLPDETDSLEKVKFMNGINGKKMHSLFDEITVALKYVFDLKSFRKLKLVKKIQNFFNEYNSENEMESFQNSSLSDSSSLVNENDSSKKKFTRFFNTKKNPNELDKQKLENKSNKTKSKNNNNSNYGSSTSIYKSKVLNFNHNNSNNQSNDKDACNNRGSFSDFRCQSIKNYFNANQLKCNSDDYVEISKKNDNKVVLDDFLLKELNQNFAYLLDTNYADAFLSIKYCKHRNFILILFESIENLSEFDLENIIIIIDVFYKKKHMKRMYSKCGSFHLSSCEKKKFNLKFLINLTKKIKIELIKLNIFIIGIVVQTPLKKLNNSNLILSSKSASEMQILGGSTIKMKYLIKN